MVNNQMLERILSKEVFSTSWVKVNGIEYRAGLAICSAMEDDMPLFSQISNILLVENCIFFLATKLFTEMFDDHQHAFRVLRYGEKCVLKMTELKFHTPFDIQSSYHLSDASFYIVPAYVMF